jgi:hypothetical protein
MHTLGVHGHPPSVRLPARARPEAALTGRAEALQIGRAIAGDAARARVRLERAGRQGARTRCGVLGNRQHAPEHKVLCIIPLAEAGVVAHLLEEARGALVDQAHSAVGCDLDSDGMRHRALDTDAEQELGPGRPCAVQ